MESCPRCITTKAAAKGRPSVAADLKQRLGETRAHPGGKAGDPRRLGVEDGRAEPNEGDRNQDLAEAVPPRQKHKSSTGRGHAGSHCIGQRPAVGIKPDQRLQDRGGALKDQGNQPYLGKAESQIVLEQGISRRDQRLHQVIQQMPQCDGKDDLDNGRVACVLGRLRSGGHRDFPAAGGPA